MHRWAFFLSSLLLIPVSAAGQNSPRDSQTLQDLLTEVRQLRRDLQSTTVAVQRAEILLYRARAQQEAVAQATQRLDRARADLAAIRKQQKDIAAFLKRAEDSPEPTGANPDELKQVQAEVPILKARLDALNNDEQEKQAAETEADQHLHDEQIKLNELQSQLDRLDTQLQIFSRQDQSHPQ